MADRTRNSEIYDGSAARQITQPKKAPQRVHKDNVRRLTDKELRKARHLSVNPMKAVASLVCVAVVFTLVAYVVYGQVQMTELTEKINAATTSLSQLESVEVQLQMQATSNMNVSELESYAKNKLNMEKINNGQISYINLATSDKGAVLVEDSQNIFEKLLGFLGF